MSNIFMLLLALAVAVSPLTGAESIAPDTPKAWSFGSSLRLEAAGEKTVSVGGSGLFLSQQSLPVDPEARYRLTGEFRSTSGKVRFYFGAACLDKGRQMILPSHMQVVPGSDTVLAADALPTDRKLSVVDAGKWRSGKLYSIAFDTDVSGKFSDLPNRNLAAARISAITPDNGKFTVALDGPAGKFYPSGTALRLHRDGPTHLYLVSWQEAPAEWQNFSGEISGVHPSALSTSQWRPGTAFARICVIANSTNLPDAKLEMRNIRLEKITK